MTEAAWLASDDPAPMLAYLLGGRVTPEDAHGWDEPRRISDRKLRLFACACAVSAPGDAEAGEGFTYWDLDPAEAARVVLGWDEADRGKARQAKAAILRCVAGNPFRPVTLPKSANPCERCGGCGYTPRDPAVNWSYGTLTEAERQRCGRCLGTGRTEGPCPWRTPDILSLARAAYEDRLPDGTLDPLTLMAVADALEEAGCTDDSQGRRTKVDVARERTHAVMGGCCDRFADFKACGCWEEAADEGLLAHLRGPGPHVRGCHALDLLLGKE
jgi:hypothetical protein